MNRLKIVQTPARFQPAVGGVEKYVLELSASLVSLGHKVTVVCADEPSYKKNDPIRGVKVIRLPYLGKVANTNITLGLFRALMNQDFDAIHTHIPTPWSADISAIVSIIKRKPLFVTYHNDLLGDGLGKIISAIYNATLLHFVLARADKIIITQPKYLEYSKHLKWHKKKIAVIPLGVSKPLSVKGVRRNNNQIFFMSVLDQHHEYKGLGVLLKAISEVKKSQPNVRLLVGGKGELIAKYKEVADSLNISVLVDFLGYVSEKKLAECYASSVLFVLPSLTHMEGFGIVALEALSYGTPTITTDLAGSSEFINQNRAGIIVSPGDASALSKAILTILDNPSLASEMGSNGSLMTSLQFNWHDIALSIVAEYYGAGI